MSDITIHVIQCTPHSTGVLDARAVWLVLDHVDGDIRHNYMTLVWMLQHGRPGCCSTGILDARAVWCALDYMYDDIRHSYMTPVQMLQHRR